MNKLFTAAAIFTLVLCCTLAANARMASDQDDNAQAANNSDANIEQAKAAALSWLPLIDSGAYAESWDESSELFRESLGKAKWETSMTVFRKPFGSVLSREFKSAEYKTSLDGAPDGEYVILQFTTSFANKAAALELVTPKKDSDGVWRVTGYYVK